MTVDAMESVIRANPQLDHRYSIGHAQYLHDDDIPRFASLNVTSQMSLQWAMPDSANLDVAVKRLGRQRVHTEFSRPRSILNAGGRVAMGTDWPAAGYYSTYKPLEAIQVAVTRKMLRGTGRAVVMPPLNERLTLEQAIEANTLSVAYQLRLEDKVGSIEVGKRADLVVLENDLFEVNHSEISNVKVLMTMMNGNVTHQDASLR